MFLIQVVLGLAFIGFGTMLGWVFVLGFLRMIYRITNNKDD